MYPINSTVKALFDANQRQIVEITMDTVGGSSYTITEADILAGSFTIDRYSITGSDLEIGTATAGECQFKIKNYNGEWDSVTFEGALLYIRIGIADWATYEDANDINWIPVGYFTVDKPVKNSNVLAVEALDRMAKFDRPVDWTNLSGSYTPVSLINALCTICGVVLNNGSALSSMPNASYTVTLPTDTDNLTYRNLLQASCALLGACAYFNHLGQLYVGWYTASGITIDESKRYSHKINENDVQVTGVYFKRDSAGGTPEEYTSGTLDYAIDISDNVLIPDGDTAHTGGVVTALGTALIGFTYRPLSAQIKPSPYLYPLDKVTFSKNGTTYTAIISKITFGINATTSIESQGKTAEDAGYATYGNYTAVQSKILQYAKEKATQAVTEASTLLLNLNELITNSLGLYVITVPVSGGGTQYYFADASTLADATIIYTFDSNGFAWTNDWNSGSPVWTYGITSTGNAILNILSVYKLSADYISAGTMQAVNLIFGQTPNTTELRTNDAQTGALFDGTGVMQFKTEGQFSVQNLATDHSTVLNSLTMTRGTTRDYSYLGNRYTNGRQLNYLSLNSYRSDSTYGTRSVTRLVNNSATSINAGEYKANELVMESITTGYNNLCLYNYKPILNYVQNSIEMTTDAVTNTKSELLIKNMNTGTTNIANSISLKHSTTENTLTVYNNPLGASLQGVPANGLTLTYDDVNGGSVRLDNWKVISTSPLAYQENGYVRIDTDGSITIQSNDDLYLQSAFGDVHIKNKTVSWEWDQTLGAYFLKGT